MYLRGDFNALHPRVPHRDSHYDMAHIGKVIEKSHRTDDGRTGGISILCTSVES